jgi:hypothetical protein
MTKLSPLTNVTIFLTQSVMSLYYFPLFNIMFTAKQKQDFLARFRDAVIPDAVLQDQHYAQAVHVRLAHKPEIMTDRVLWSAACEYASGLPKIAKSPDVGFVWAAVSFVQRTPTGEKQVGQVLFPGSWALHIYGKWLVLWHHECNLIQAAHERYNLTAHHLVNRGRGLLLARHENLDETLGVLLSAQRMYL